MVGAEGRYAKVRLAGDGIICIFQKRLCIFCIEIGLVIDDRLGKQGSVFIGVHWPHPEHILSDLFRFACQKRISIVSVHDAGHFPPTPGHPGIYDAARRHELPVDIEIHGPRHADLEGGRLVAKLKKVVSAV
jgi:hypothetical protein